MNAQAEKLDIEKMTFFGQIVDIKGEYIYVSPLRENEKNWEKNIELLRIMGSKGIKTLRIPKKLIDDSMFQIGKIIAFRIKVYFAEDSRKINIDPESIIYSS